MQTYDLSFRADPRRTCKVRVGQGVLAFLAEDLEPHPAPALVAILADSNVASLYAEPLARRLREFCPRVELLDFPAGEVSKTRETKTELEDRLCGMGAGRDTLLIAVGGGVTGDLAGFVAATWHRGIPVIQVPTSLLAMVDASIGGKTAVNLPAGKNLVGSFHQPRAVYADTEVLETLAQEEYVAGLAEVVKSGCIADAALFRWLEQSAEAILERDAEVVERLVAGCVEIKGRVVRRDEREGGRRAMLNFGHTVGHAFEAVSGYRERHGVAIARGMCVEARLACRLTGFPEAHRTRLEALLVRLGLPHQFAAGIDLEAIVASTRRDKKARGGEVHYALPARIGKMPAGKQLTCPVDEQQLRRALAESQTPGD